jgi:predicted Zn finger-like uncharacterized protein
MIVSCPECATRIRLDKARLAGKRVKLRCSRCGGVFQADVPVETADSALVLSPELMPQESLSSACPRGQIDVLVAHSDPNLCATIGDVLSRHADLSWWSCHNGDEALAGMEKRVPTVAIVDVALPGLFAFEVVEKVRKRPGLASVRLVLLSSVYNKMAYKRTPHSLYGADDYIEKHHIAIDLVDKIRHLARMSPRSATAVPATFAPPDAPEAFAERLAAHTDANELQRIQEVNSRIIDAEQSEVAVFAGTDEAMIKAQRLARIIVSDIALYNQDLVEEGVRNGTFFVLLASEVQEGRRLFNERIGALIPDCEGILEQAFNTFIERRRRELSLS